jgi:hypothetical protein
MFKVLTVWRRTIHDGNYEAQHSWEASGQAWLVRLFEIRSYVKGGL